MRPGAGGKWEPVGQHLSVEERRGPQAGEEDREAHQA